LSFGGHTHVDEDDSDEINVRDCDEDEDRLIDEEENNYD